ncbi:MAG: hypothetical protein HY308_15985 [Gammaproteobacteria bacterium]|nr:hypothetical protein [Gammaproteobacteria bacterium]
MRYWLGIFAVLLLCVGCEEKPPKETVFDPLLKTKEKARAVEGQVKQSAEQQAAEINKATTEEGQQQ